RRTGHLGAVRRRRRHSAGTGARSDPPPARDRPRRPAGGPAGARLTTRRQPNRHVIRPPLSRTTVSRVARAVLAIRAPPQIPYATVFGTNLRPSVTPRASACNKKPPHNGGFL